MKSEVYEVKREEKKALRTHHDLEAWKRSMDLVVRVYRETRSFPRDEAYGLTSQIRRAVISIPCNIAEGAARNSVREFIQFLFIALSSASELETQVILAERLSYVTENAEILAEIRTIKKMIHGLIAFLKKKK